MSFTPSSRTALTSIGLLLFAIMVTLAALSA
jgi:hypothetical protein